MNIDDAIAVLTPAERMSLQAYCGIARCKLALQYSLATDGIQIRVLFPYCGKYVDSIHECVPGTLSEFRDIVALAVATLHATDKGDRHEEVAIDTYRDYFRPVGQRRIS